MSGAGSILQGVGSLLKGMAGNAAGRAQYRALNLAADQAQQEAGISTAMTLEQGQRQSADLVVSAAAGGGGTTGSPLDALRDLQRQISFQALNTVVEGNNKAANLRYEARVAKRQGVLGEQLGMLDAGASFLNAFDQVNQKAAGIQ